MFFKERLLDLASSLANSASQIALKSLGQSIAFWPRNDLSCQGRLRLKRGIERFLCLHAEDTTSCPPASIRERAAGHDGKDLFINWAKSCHSWFKRKYMSRKAKGKGSFSTFEQVINNMDLSTLPEYASSLRRSRAGAGLDQASDFGCTLGLSPMLGSYNVLFPVLFKDGVRWLFKIPAAGYVGRWDSSAARSLRSEALTMQMLQRRTSIPIPKVYSFDASLENNFKCPFILMEHIGGEPLYKKWYNGFSSAVAQEKFRERALQGLAAAAVQLSAFQYPQAGAPSFDENEKLQAIEPVRVVDLPTSHSRLFEGIYDVNGIFCEIGPYHNAGGYFRSMLDKHNLDNTVITQGTFQVLRLFIDWISKEGPVENETFFIAHPDFNLQNVLVAEDGTVQGLIDWDGVSTVPCSVGSLFPKWLTLDWDPANYTYGMDLGWKIQPRQHSPTELKHYRALYAQFIGESVTKYQPQFGNIPPELEVITRRSLVIDSVNQAAKNPFSTAHNVYNILSKIAHVTSQTYFKAYCDAFECTMKRGQSAIPAEQNLRIEDVAQAEEDSSTNGSSDLSDSVFSTTSTVTGESTELSESSSEPEEQQAAAIQYGDAEPSGSNGNNEQRIVNQDLSTNLDERCLKLPKEIKRWRRVPSLVQSASRQLRASVKRLKVTKSQRTESSGVSLSPDAVPTDTSKTTSTTSAGDSSKIVSINQPEHWSTTLAPITDDEASCGNGGNISATASDHLDLEMISNEDIMQRKTNESYTDGQSYLSHHAAIDQRQIQVSSTEQQSALVHTQEEQDDGSSPSNSLSATSERQKDSFGRRLKAKLTIPRSKKGNGVRASSPSFSADSGDSRRKRILAWIRKTSHKRLSSEQNSESSWNSDSTLPEIDHVSLFDIPSLDEAGFKTNDDLSDINDTRGDGPITMTKPVIACATKLPSYDAGDPVDKHELQKEGFTTSDICYDIAEGNFDEARMRRLRLGFAALLDSL